MAQDKEANYSSHPKHTHWPVQFKAVIYLILKHIYTIVALTQSPGRLFHACIVRRENAYFIIYNLHPTPNYDINCGLSYISGFCYGYDY